MGLSTERKKATAAETKKYFEAINNKTPLPENMVFDGAQVFHASEYDLARAAAGGVLAYPGPRGEEVVITDIETPTEEPAPRTKAKSKK